MLNKSLAILFFLMAVIACSSSETIIKDRRVTVTVPAIKDSLAAEYKEIPVRWADSLDIIFNQLPDSARIEAVSKANPRTIIKYYPKKKIFEIDIAEHKIDTTFADTLQLNVKKETTLSEKFGYALIGIIIFFVICVVVYIKFK